MPRCTPRWPPPSDRPPRPAARSPRSMSEDVQTSLAAGRLLVSTPLLLDPNFERSVVLLLDVAENGNLGIALSRPSTVRVVEVLPEWGEVAGTPGVLFQGGPVSTDSALAVGGLPPG